MQSEHEHILVWGMNSLVTGYRMHWEHKRYYCGLRMDALVIGCTRNWGMDALVIGCTRNTNIIMVWGMHALVIGCTGNTYVIMVWAEVLRASGSFRPTACYYPPPPPPPPPQHKAQKPARQGTEIPRVLTLFIPIINLFTESP